MSIVVDDRQCRIPVITPTGEDLDRFDIGYPAYEVRSSSVRAPEHQLGSFARRIVGGTEKAIARHLDLCAERWIIDLETSATAGVSAGEIIEFVCPVRVLFMRLTLWSRLIKPLERGSRGKDEHGTAGASNQLRNRLASEHSTEKSPPVRSSDNKIRIKLLGAGEK